MLSLQEISDRLEIQDLLIAYSHAIDLRNWDELDDVFTPDAVIDYTEMGGPRGTLDSIKAYLAETLSRFPSYQHLVATTKIVFDGDRAEGRTVCHNPMVLDDKERVMWCGLWYRDRFVRTPAGWRIADRYEERCYIHGLPVGKRG